MRLYEDVDYKSVACVHKDSAKLFALGIKGIMDATGWDLPLTMKRISEESGITLNSIRQMRTGDRNPTRSAVAVSAAIVKLGGPKIVFPSQAPDGKGGVASEAASSPDEMVDAISITITFAEAKRRLAAIFDAPESAIKIVDFS